MVSFTQRHLAVMEMEITLLDELESQVEDPDLLKGLFTIDHLATRMRRQSESLAVLGGATSRRKWSKPVSLYEVLRSSVAEVEHYSRVKVVPPVTGTLHGSAVVDVIHLIAELIENATKFSPPSTQVMLRAENVPAGVAIDIEDRGLGMQSADVHRMNALLADPGQIDIGELLRDGRIGLYVVSALAGKHDVRVQLQRNVFGGTQAVVLLPNTLVGADVQAVHPQAAFYQLGLTEKDGWREPGDFQHWLGVEDIIRQQIVLLVTALGLGTVGVFWSALLKRTQAATVLTYCTMLALTIGTLLLFVFWTALVARRYAARGGAQRPGAARPPCRRARSRTDRRLRRPRPRRGGGRDDPGRTVAGRGGRARPPRGPRGRRPADRVPHRRARVGDPPAADGRRAGTRGRAGRAHP
jgi:hypothetical protein